MNGVRGLMVFVCEEQLFSEQIPGTARMTIYDVELSTRNVKRVYCLCSCNRMEVCLNRTQRLGGMGIVE